MIHSEFVLSAAAAADFPQTGFPEVALVGRSNVGKSSLINALVQKVIARTSAAPGKTRLANYYAIELPAMGASAPRRSFYLVDLPGYGYARGGTDAAEEFEALTAQYFAATDAGSRTLAGVLHLIDARHPDLPQDAWAHRWITDTGLPLAIVATKVDKLNQADRARTLRTLADRYSTSVLPTSAREGAGIQDVWKLLRGWTGQTG